MNLLRRIGREMRNTQSLLRFLLIQRSGRLSPPSHPEFDNETLERFRVEVARASSYLEYGSGGSTLIVDAAGIPALSVESDRFYAEKVRGALRAGTSVQMAVPPMGLTKQWGMPVFKAGRKGASYVTAPFGQMEGWFPDLVLVDGRYRVACVLEVARRAKEAKVSTTIILDDYRGRPHYHVVACLLGPPEMAGRSAIFRVGRQAVEVDAVSAHMSDAR